MNFNNKKVVVTGAASGIGAATAKKLKALGATIIGLDINEPKENVDTYIKVDLTDSSSIRDAVKACPEGIDAICNIAGVPPTVPPSVQMKVNFYGLREFTDLMLNKLNKGAAIMNLASVVGSKYAQHIPQIKTILASSTYEEIEDYINDQELFGEVTYAFSKEVVILWTLKMASICREKGFTIKSLSPGPVKTPILKDFMESIVKKQALPPTGFEGDPDEIAGIATFLISENANWINGRDIISDGGLSATRMSSGMEL